MSRLGHALGAVGLVLVSALVSGGPAQAGPVPRASVPHAAATQAAPDPGARTLSKTISRSHLVNGAEQKVDSRKVTVSIETTRNLRDRQAVKVSWTGAHPTGGIVSDHNAGIAALQEYPVVVMQCRGVDSTAVPANQRIRPQSCWTQTPDERFQFSQSGTVFPPYRMDRYATREHRAETVDQPNPLPRACSALTAAHWVPFVAVDGARYSGGPQGCAGLAPEAANAADSLQPGSTTYGVADAEHGYGTAQFVMQNDDSNASLGCSTKVKCSLVVIPIMGISCDVAGTAPGADLGMTPDTRPSPLAYPTLQRQCGQTGHFAPASFNPGASESPDLPVTGSLWWSESNWRNRFSVPLSFAPSASVCDVVGNSASVYAYGSEALLQATQQWSPHFCLDPKLFTLRHVQTSEPQAKNLLNTGSIEAAIQAGPPSTPFVKPTVQAPAALSGFAVAYSIDGAKGQPYGTLRLNARLLAKLLSESYRSCATCLDFDSKDARHSGFARLATNPIDISRDPEFQALNPGIPVTNYLQSAATLEFMSSDSDLMTALTRYIDADPEAREWLNGYPDPWGMVVNPAYKGIDLPVTNWQLLDRHIARLPGGANSCLAADPVPWLPLVASPVSNPATVALHMQFDIANSQINCKDNGQITQRLTAVGRQTPGIRFVLGLVSLGDAARYQLHTAQLQSVRTSTSDGEFDNAAGRVFVGPTDAAITAAGRLMRPDDSMGTWPVPYSTLRSAAGRAAYPGTVLLSVDVPTKGLPRADALRYSQVLSFLAGRGQVRGLGIGDLPPGYVPLNASGLTGMSAYTARAAAAVAAQDGQVPYVSGRAGGKKPNRASPVAPPRTPPIAPPPAATPRAGVQPAAGNGANPSSGPSSGPSSAPKSSAPKSSSAPSQQPNAAPVGNAGPLGAGALGLVLPVLVVIAAVAAGVAVWTSGMGRRR